MTIKYVSSWSQICAQITYELSKPLDPLTLNTVIVPTSGHHRELSQYIAANLDAQVCAGVDFITPRGLYARLITDLLNMNLQSDPWRQTNVALALVEAFEQSFTQSWFEPLASYFRTGGERPGRRLDTARRISRLFWNYFRLKPELLAAWTQNQDVDQLGQPLATEFLWQPHLWRAARRIISSPDPLERQKQLLTAIKTESAKLPDHLFGCLVTKLPRYQQEVIDALGNHICVWALAAPESKYSLLASRYSLNRPIAEVATPGKPNSTLGQVQRDILLDRLPSEEYLADGSIQFHLSHGPHRQVEVLRDVLTGLFQSDATLKPADVLVLVPNLDKYATHIAAAFGQDSEGVHHPGTNLRVRLASSSLVNTNPVREALAVLLRLLRGRAKVSEFIGFISLEPVARKFDFDGDDIAQIKEILANANVSWGIDTAHRQSYGLTGQTLGTWWKGVESALLGAVFADDPTTVLGDVVATKNMESGMLELLGKLSEVLSRIRKAKFCFAKPTDATHWVERLRNAMDELTEVGPIDGWQKITIASQLNTLAQAASGLGAQLSLSEVTDWFEDMTEQSFGRPNFGSGDLLVASLAELQAVERRVICLLGMGEEDFPWHRRRLGDDLLADEPEADDLRIISRQQFIDAVLAASDKFIVVTQGASQHSGAISSAPVVMLDLLSACGIPNPNDAWENASTKLVHRYPLQAHSKKNFIGDSPSFDTQALSGARAKLLQPCVKTPPSTWIFPEPQLGEVTGDKLLDFLRNPAAELMSFTTGVKLKLWDEELSEQLPISPTGLDKYKIRKHLVEARLAGKSYEQALYVEALSGQVLRNEAGNNLIKEIANDAEEIVRNVQTIIAGQRVDYDCSLNLEMPLRWQVTTFNNQVVIYRCGGLKGSALVEAWLQLAFLAASGQPAEKAVVIFNGQSRLLHSPSKEEAEGWLIELARLYRAGLTELVPLPAETAAAFVGLVGRGRGGLWSAKAAWHDRYRHFGEWDNDESWQYFFPNPDELFGCMPRPSDPTANRYDPNSSRFMQLADWLYQPIRKSFSKNWRSW